MSIESMKQALEALELMYACYAHQEWISHKQQEEKILAQCVATTMSLRQAIAEAEKQEPHGYLKLSNAKFYYEVEGVLDLDCNPDYLPLYTHPQPKREPLTDEQILSFVNAAPALDTAEAEWLHVARAIEAKLKEKNT